MTISLTGPMGCGKSSVGRKLSTLLGGLCAPDNVEGRIVLIDLDDYIVKRAGKSIPEIFAEGGEEEFRLIETRCLTEVLDWSEGKGSSFGYCQEQAPDFLILSLGGGAILKNSGLIHQRSKCIYLRAKVDTLLGRLEGRSAGRPLLAKEAGDELRQKIESILDARQDLYISTSHYIIDTDGKNVYQVAKEIIDTLNS